MSAALPELLGLTVSESIAFAVGIAMGPALHPIVQELTNESWALAPFKPVDLGDAASIVAENVAEYQWGENEAGNTGYDPDRFKKVLGAALNAPGLPELLRLWRRGEITEADFVHGLRKARFETRWDVPVESLRQERLDPALVSLAIQRRVVTDPGYLIDPPPISGSNVPPMPVSPLDAVAEARAEGINEERLAVETRLRGIPPAPGELMQMVNRNIINEDAFNLGVVEGDTRQEWAPFLFRLRRRLLTPHEYAELQLRGYLTAAQRDTGAELSGMTAADTQLLYDVLGRSIPVHQITTGLARGGVFEGPADTIPKSYLQSLQRGNLRPEYYNLGYANRYSYPSAFVTRALLSGGAISEAEGEQIFLDVGWRPDLAKKVASFYAVTTGPVADKHVAKAETQLWTTTHRSYIAEESGDVEAKERFDVLGIPAAAQTRILELWTWERALTRKQLTPAQVKKAYREGVVNPATGAPFTRDDAIGELLTRGYSMADATVFITE